MPDDVGNRRDPPAEAVDAEHEERKHQHQGHSRHNAPATKDPLLLLAWFPALSGS
jgi:hypothetical protein